MPVRQQSVQAGELDHLIVGAGGQDPVEAGLIGAGVARRHAVIGQDGNQPVGGEEFALGCFPLPMVQAEAASGNSGFKEDRTSLHKCDG